MHKVDLIIFLYHFTAGVHGIVDEDHMVTVNYIDSKGKPQGLDAHIVKIPRYQKMAHNKENRLSFWVEHNEVENHITRPEMLQVWAQMKGRIAPPSH